MEEFVKLQIHKFKPNLKKSKSVMQQMSKHKVVFGGSVGVQDANAEGAFGTSHFGDTPDAREKLMEDIRNNNLSIGIEDPVKENDNEGDASSGDSRKSENSDKKSEAERVTQKRYMDANRHRVQNNRFFRKNTKLAEKVLNELERMNREKTKSPKQLTEKKVNEEKRCKVGIRW